MSQSRSGRTVSVTLLVALVAAMVLWLRNRTRPIQVEDPPEWPPLPPLDDDDGSAPVETAPDETAPVETAPDETAPIETAPVETAEATAADEAATETDAPWRPAGAEGGCPDGYPIKAKDSSGIFHVPGGRFYDRTKADRCYPDAESAVADGYRQAKT